VLDCFAFLVSALLAFVGSSGLVVLRSASAAALPVALPLPLLLCLFRCPGLLCVVVRRVVSHRRTRDRVWLKCEC
jgi:hypothetical protein